MNATAITPAQLAILKAATAWEEMSERKRSTIHSLSELQRYGYLASYSANTWPDIGALVEAGFLEHHHTLTDGKHAVFHVTEEGFALMLRYVGVPA